MPTKYGKRKWMETMPMARQKYNPRGCMPTLVFYASFCHFYPLCFGCTSETPDVQFRICKSGMGWCRISGKRLRCDAMRNPIFHATCDFWVCKTVPQEFAIKTTRIKSSRFSQSRTIPHLFLWETMGIFVAYDKMAGMELCVMDFVFQKANGKF